MAFNTEVQFEMIWGYCYFRKLPYVNGCMWNRVMIWFSPTYWDAIPKLSQFHSNGVSLRTSIAGCCQRPFERTHQEEEASVESCCASQRWSHTGIVGSKCSYFGGELCNLPIDGRPLCPFIPSISFHIMQWLSSIYILLISHVGLAMVYTLGPTTRSNLGIWRFHHRMDR